MAITKKTLEEELETQAKTKEDVDAMSAADRLYDSLSYSYGRKKESSNKAYDKAISQQNNALLQRGMQRSSYGLQTVGNLQDQKVKAQGDIDSEMIADYENKLYQVEQDELEEAWRQKEFEANRSDAAFNQEMQTKQFEAGRSDTEWEQAFQTQQFDYSKATNDQKLAIETINVIAANGGNASDDLLQRAGISRADFNAMKKAATSTSKSSGTSSTPAWKKAGFNSNEEYQKALAAGCKTKAEYTKYLQNELEKELAVTKVSGLGASGIIYGGVTAKTGYNNLRDAY